MYRRIGFCLLALGAWASPAHAQSCAGFPTLPDPLANNTLADAIPVMADLNFLGGCTAPLASPSFTGTLVVGSTSTTGQLVVASPNSTSMTTSFIGINMYGAQSIGASGTYYGINVSPTFTSSDTLSGFNGIHLIPQNTGAGTVTDMKAVFANPENTGTGAVTNMYGVYSQPLNNTTTGSTGSVTNMYGVYSAPRLGGTASTATTTMEALYGNCQVADASATVQYCYELYLDTPQGAGRIGAIYGVYQNYASAFNYFAGNVGIGTVNPAQALEVNGQVKIDTFAGAGSNAVCQISGVLSGCSSSLRYKENVKSATFGLDDVMQMRPVTFKWKGRDENDLGLIAEEVAKIDPLFVTYKDGKIEGVKYAQLTAVLVGAIKELKTQNDTQARELSALKSENAALKAGYVAFDRRLDALETKARIHNAWNVGRTLRPAAGGGGG